MTTSWKCREAEGRLLRVIKKIWKLDDLFAYFCFIGLATDTRILELYIVAQSCSDVDSSA